MTVVTSAGELRFGAKGIQLTSDNQLGDAIVEFVPAEGS
jgi:hypothetical protein